MFPDRVNRQPAAAIALTIGSTAPPRRARLPLTPTRWQKRGQGRETADVAVTAVAVVAVVVATEAELPAMLAQILGIAAAAAKDATPSAAPVAAPVATWAADPTRRAGYLLGRKHFHRLYGRPQRLGDLSRGRCDLGIRRRKRADRLRQRPKAGVDAGASRSSVAAARRRPESTGADAFPGGLGRPSAARRSSAIASHLSTSSGITKSSGGSLGPECAADLGVIVGLAEAP